MKPPNPYMNWRNDDYSVSTLQAAWDKGYAAGLAAAEPKWTRVDIEDPSTWPPGWERYGSKTIAQRIGGLVLFWYAHEHVQAEDRCWQRTNCLVHGDYWVSMLPAPPKEEP